MTYFKGMAPTAGPKWQQRYANMAAALADAGLMAELQRDNPGLHALIRNTCSMTRLGGSNKINVIPPRRGPRSTAACCPIRIRSVLNELETCSARMSRSRQIMGFTPASSSADNDPVSAFARRQPAQVPGAWSLRRCRRGSPTAISFATWDPAYGFAPTVVPLEDGGVHGNNERISVENIRRGVLMMRDIVWRFAVN